MSAVISDCGRYRYRLERHGLSGVGAIAWIMVNPSTADATTDDATIRKVVGFTERLGGGWAIVGNLFAYRATDIKDLKPLSYGEARGPDNDEHLRAIFDEASQIIVAHEDGSLDDFGGGGIASAVARQMDGSLTPSERADAADAILRAGKPS